METTKLVFVGVVAGALLSPLSAQIGVPGERGGRGYLQDKIFGQDQEKIGIARSIGDIDGDDCDDFLVGTVHSTPFPRVDVYSGQTLTVIRSHDDGATTNDFARAFGSAGDLNGDGIQEYLISAPDSSSVTTDGGIVHVYDGATGSMLLSFGGTVADGHFGASLHGGDDVTGDGIADVLVMALSHSSTGGGTEVQLFSGADYSPSGWLPSLAVKRTQLSQFLATAPDADGDGIDDIVIIRDGTPRIYSSVTGAELWLPSLSPDTFARVNDLDGDGVDDLALGSMSVGANAPDGTVTIYSGATRTEIYTLAGELDMGEMFGASVTNLGDVDGDGSGDFAVGSPSHDAASVYDHGKVKIFSGIDGARLYVYDALPTAGLFGYFLSSADTDGDGRLNILSGAPQTAQFTAIDAGVIVVIGFDPLMLISSHEISAAAGGTVEFNIDFPASHTKYMLLASRAGTSPVTMQGGIPVPLVYDNVTLMMAQSPPAWFSNTQGGTNAFGQETAYLNLAPNDAAHLVGQVFWFALLGYGGSEGHGMHWSSVAQQLTVLP